MSSIEEQVFELAEQHTVADLDKLIRLLNLVLNGKKNIAIVSIAPVTTPAPAPKTAKASPKATTPDPSEDEGF